MLVVGERRIAPSLAILEYLEEKHPQPPLLPKDLYGRARVRSLALLVACEIHPLNNLRTLNHLRRDRNVAVDFVPVELDGRVDPDEIAARFRPNTKLVAVNHGSNVIGTIQPVAEIGRRCRERGIVFLIDAAQTAGVIPIDVEAMCVDLIAFTGHKSLLGPTGTGGLYVRDGVEARSTRFGETGVHSIHPYHLEEYPYRLVAGTGNVLGAAVLHFALVYL